MGIAGTNVLRILSVIIGYCTVSIALIFANKYLVTDQNSISDISLFVIWIQCVITTLSITCITCMNILSASRTGNWNEAKVSTEQLMQPHIIRLSCTYVSMLTFNTLCLRFVGVSFFQIARSTTLIFVVVFSITILRKSVSCGILGCCVVIILGFILGVDQEQFLGTLSIKGVICGVLSSIFGALNGTCTKLAVHTVSSSYKMIYYMNINASLLMIPLILISGQFHNVISSMMEWTMVFWILLLITGILSLLIGWVSGVQIKLTSVITHNIIVNSKAILQTMIAVLYYNEDKPVLWWFSILLQFGGAVSYTIMSIQQTKDQSQKQDQIVVKIET